MVRSERRVLIVAGGTGGHISPGVALAWALKERGVRVLFLTLEKNRGASDFKDPPFEVFTYGAPPLRRSLPALLLFPFRFLRALRKARSILRTYEVDGVVGMGGFPTLPALLAGRWLGRPLFLCEQNSIPGRVTLFFSRTARLLFLSLPDRAGLLRERNAKSLLVGNPLRPALGALIRGETRSEEEEDTGEDPFDLLETRAAKGSGEAKPLRVLVLGGSQGAVQLNEMTIAAVRSFPEVSWVLQCGVKNLDELNGRLSPEEYPNLRLLGYYDRIERLYRRADLLLCRSGAGVLTEAAAFGLPMILVPYPFAKDNHQLDNALHFEEKGAAVVINRKDNDPGELTAHLRRLLADPEERRRMGEAARSLSRPDAAGVIAQRIEESLSGRAPAEPEGGGTRDA
jgi:UDP-N-acetylglucosamine--N-acetylmuramyl-(pentapeptide) pyrophosphoryl-undecaprenol N-acetylglucosamine transferase